ncbi:MAG: hypothetical protein WBM39_01650 [Parasphingorhabdus sp.]
MSSSTAANWLRVVAIGSMLTGIVMAVGSVSDPTGVMSLFFGLVSSGDSGIGGIATPEAKLALAVAGGVFAGFAAMFLFIVAPAVKAGDAGVRRGVIISLIIWYVIDSGASVASGNAANAVANTGMLLLFILPLVLVKSETA